jgi:predicted O-methyltransferase YrrM
MKAFPELTVRFKELFYILHGPLRANLLLAAIELKIFTLLIRPLSASEVTQLLNSHPDNTRYFMDALAACDLIKKKSGIYYNTPEGEQFLVEGQATYLGDLFKLQHQLTSAALENLTDLVQYGPPPNTHDASSDKTWGEMTAIAANYQRSGYAQQMSELVSSLPEFRSFKRMLDLGGGAGLVGIAIVAKHPTMKGVLFEQPSVAKVAEQFVAEYGMQDRMQTIGGDYINDPIGSDYDLIWAGATLNFAKGHIDKVMKKIYDALNPGGVFVSYHEGLTDERTKPEAILLDMFAERMLNIDWSEDQGWIANSMIRAGFKTVHSKTVEAVIGVMDLDIGRK